MDKAWLDLLHRGTSALSINLNDEQIIQLLNFVFLLIKWNKIHNLTTITKPRQIIIKHILDSLSIMPFVNEKPLLDIGSGTGMPGLALAIAKPNLKVSLLDSVLRKCHFLQAASISLNLKNTNIIHSRVQDYRPRQYFGQISARAFANVDKTLALSRHLLCADGCYLLMKSDKFFKEKCQTKIKLTTHNLVVPFLQQKRYLLIINK